MLRWQDHGFDEDEEVRSRCNQHKGMFRLVRSNAQEDEDEDEDDDVMTSVSTLLPAEQLVKSEHAAVVS